MKSKDIRDNRHDNKFVNCKAIVFQSDDWGLCSYCPDLEAFYELFDNNKNPRILKHGKSTLESPDDMDRLFNILLKYRGGDGKPVVFQPAYVMSNPDYDSIESDGFKAYSDLVIPHVPSRWQRGDFVAKAKEGIEKGIWCPIFHGNTHFDRFKWMDLVGYKDKAIIEAFNYQISVNINSSDDYEYDSKLKTKQQELSISIGIKRFYDTFGYYPISVIAPTYVWQSRTEKIFAEHGIKIIEGKNLQNINRTFFDKVKGKLENWSGRTVFDKTWQVSMCDYNPKQDLYYLHRNVYFEPFGSKDAKHGAEMAYKGIVKAWENNQPAVVCTHRINYVHLDNHWVEESLNQLDMLLNRIQNNHPDAVYLTDYEVIQTHESELKNGQKEKNSSIHL